MTPGNTPLMETWRATCSDPSILALSSPPIRVTHCAVGAPVWTYCPKHAILMIHFPASRLKHQIAAFVNSFSHGVFSVAVPTKARILSSSGPGPDSLPVDMEREALRRSVRHQQVRWPFYSAEIFPYRGSRSSPVRKSPLLPASSLDFPDSLRLAAQAT